MGLLSVGFFRGIILSRFFCDKSLLLLGIFWEGVPLFLGFFWPFCLRLIAGEVSRPTCPAGGVPNQGGGADCLALNAIVYARKGSRYTGYIYQHPTIYSKQGIYNRVSPPA